ncbi:MAG: hypothetical protein EAZ61_00075 [Oscillatoriales cyanobacterium]|nr:MAG: hypothetical protein EAZ61_00075 [Oscillatoriales cyanobacterium]
MNARTGEQDLEPGNIVGALPSTPKPCDGLHTSGWVYVVGRLTAEIPLRAAMDKHRIIIKPVFNRTLQTLSVPIFGVQRK